MTNEIVLFNDGNVNIEVQINPEQETVWLTQKQIETLFGVSHATVSEHISNILKSGELDDTSVGFSDKSTGGRKPKIYNLDMILSVGYRVNSKKGIAFRRWANGVLKQYIMEGYAINEKRMFALQKTVNIQTKMLAYSLDLEEKEILKAVKLCFFWINMITSLYKNLREMNRFIELLMKNVEGWLMKWKIHLNQMYSALRKRRVRLKEY